MANYFVINNKFKPYSFDELIKPYQLYAKEYDEQEEALGDLESKAATLEAALSQENDPVAYATYANYLNKVREAADDIATRGLNNDSRRNVRVLSTEFNQNITPIQSAYNRRKELQDEQRKALLSNPTLYFQRNFNDTTSPEASLDRFVENPNYDYGNFFSGALLEKQVSDAASVLAKELTNYGQGKRLDSFTKTFMQQHGFTRDQVLNAINNPNSPDSPAVLNAIVESVVGGSGVADWNDKKALDTAYNSARRGLFSAVGQTSVSPYDDYGAKLAAQIAAQKPTTTQEIPINPLNIFSSAELTEAGKNIRQYSKYFRTNPDGSIELTEEGEKEYNRTSTPSVGGGRVITTPEGTTILTEATPGSPQPSEFRTFIDELTNGETITPGKAWQNYLNDHDADRYDARRNTEYDYKIESGDQAEFKSSVITAAKGAPLQEVEYDSSTHSWKPTGKTFSTNDLADKKYTVTNVRMSSSGTQVIVQKDGDTYRLELPRGINPRNETNRNEALSRADLYRKAIVEGIYSNEAERLKLLESYRTALQSAYMYQSQLGLGYKTKPEEFYPYAY